MKIKEIEITGLFGAYNHVISFADTDIKFIYGTNGIGKTTILNLLDWLFHLNLTNLAKIQEIPFESFCVSFGDNDGLEIRKFPNRTTLSFSCNHTEWEYDYRHYFSSEYKIKEYEFAEIIRKKTNFKQVSPNTFSIDESNVLTLQDIAEKYPNYFTLLEIANFTNIPIEIINTIITTQVHLIPVNRLNENTVTRSMEQLALNLQQKERNFHKLSDTLKQTQRERIKKKEIKLDWENDEIEKYIENLLDTVQYYQYIGILDDSLQKEDFIFPEEGSELEKQLFYIQVQDFSLQLAVYEMYGFDKKLHLFYYILRSMFEPQESHKTNIVDRRVWFDFDEGVCIYAKDEKGYTLVTQPHNKKIPLQKLSSGEQQQIILWYKILFEFPDNSLILMDEPETSLHIDWQMDFLPNLQAVQEIKPLSFLIATHSSAIINGHFELAKSLNDAD